MAISKLAKILLCIPLLLGAPACGEKSPAPSAKEMQSAKEAEIRSAVVNYVAQPKFSGKGILEQITSTKANLERYNLDEQMLYFSINAGEFTNKVTAQIAVDCQKVEFATTRDGKFSGEVLRLGSYVFRSPNEYFFRTPADNFRVDPDDKISIPFRNIVYTQTAEELAGFISNRNVYGGYLRADIGKDEIGRHIIRSNHGAFVAKKGEPSLERLVNQIAPKDKSIEEKAQLLLDFVTKNMTYNYSEAYEHAKVLKRPNEVLMTGNSDCSGLTILYASLLEQTEADYRLVYAPEHTTVAVAGNFPARNGMRFNLGKTTYTFAEPTARRFVIGETTIKNPFTVDSIQQFQKPGKDSPILDGKTGEPVPFR